jgi:hypothetical protein
MDRFGVALLDSTKERPDKVVVIIASGACGDTASEHNEAEQGTVLLVIRIRAPRTICWPIKNKLFEYVGAGSTGIMIPMISLKFFA